MSRRDEQKERTRRALLDAALGQLTTEGFGAISLRRVTKVVGISPAAFYKHFTDMEELGLVLVDDALSTLREMISGVRRDGLPSADVIRGSVEVLRLQVRASPEHFRFIARERYGGLRSIRDAIADGLQAFEDDLRGYLAQLLPADRFDERDLRLFTHLIVLVAVHFVAEMVDAPEADYDRLVSRAEEQMRLVSVGIAGWNPGE